MSLRSVGCLPPVAGGVRGGGAGSGLLGPVCVPFDDVQLLRIKLATGKKKKKVLLFDGFLHLSRIPSWGQGEGLVAQPGLHLP